MAAECARAGAAVSFRDLESDIAELFERAQSEYVQGDAMSARATAEPTHDNAHFAPELRTDSWTALQALTTARRPERAVLPSLEEARAKHAPFVIVPLAREVWPCAGCTGHWDRRDGNRRVLHVGPRDCPEAPKSTRSRRPASTPVPSWSEVRAARPVYCEPVKLALVETCATCGRRVEKRVGLDKPQHVWGPGPRGRCEVPVTERKTA
jgi:hypothetical protein